MLVVIDSDCGSCSSLSQVMLIIDAAIAVIDSIQIIICANISHAQKARKSQSSSDWHRNSEQIDVLHQILN
jgi:hypothetical protein